MPTYQSPRHGVLLSEAYAEAAATARIDRVMLHTFEVRHPSLAEPLRIVKDYTDLQATLEMGAPANPGAGVTFLASEVRVGRPEESDTAASPEIELSLDNVSGVVSTALKAARGSREIWEVTERVYASDDLSAPAKLPPLTLTLTQGEIRADSVTFRASFDDPVNVAIPSKTFTVEKYPGLVSR